MPTSLAVPGGGVVDQGNAQRTGLHADIVYGHGQIGGVGAAGQGQGGQDGAEQGGTDHGSGSGSGRASGHRFDVPEVTFCAGPIADGRRGRQHLAMPSLLRHLLRPLSLAGLVTVLAVGLSFAVQRGEAAQDWSLVEPRVVPEFTDLFGEAFEQAYLQAEAQGKANRTISARKLYARMMRTLAETGNGWMTFKDKCNRASNQTLRPGNVIHLSNLCTEILEVTSNDETAVCNLGSINLGNHFDEHNAFDYEKLAATVRLAVRQLARVIDLNFYPIETARRANLRWRPVGLGCMGLQDVFFRKRLPFDSADARALSKKIAEAIYFHALETSCELAQERGKHPSFNDTRAASGELQFDAWNVVPEDTARWDALRERIKEHGLRNSLMIAIAPTATIASIAGCYECVEPQVSNLFKRETLSGDFLQVNRYLVNELKKLGLWTADMRDAIKLAEGSIAGVAQIPETLREVYRTAWELPMRSLIDMAAERGAFIDQSASLNLFMESPNIGAMSSMYMYAWKQGIKTTYYLRSRPATKIAKTTVSSAAPAKVFSPDEAIACSLENPEACEACHSTIQDSPVRDPESNALEFVAGCAVDADIYYLAARIGPGHECYDPDPGPPSRMFFYQHQTDEKWFYHDLSDWQVESAIFIPEQQDGRERRVLALDFYGHLEDLARSGTKCELIPPEGDHFCGGLTRVRQLGKDLFCCGVHGMICHRSETGWKQLPTHFPAPERGSLKDDLESIDFDNWLACVGHLARRRASAKI
ncbi:hypothetical protein G6F57_012686 [Rhizopus arrhizus]|nr:hypothetical protein G6F57_012686 [Rhizopus arrhizus]